MKQLLIYQSPLALNRGVHRDIRLKSGPIGYGFARELNSVPLTTAEFSLASHDYPIVFAGEGDEVSLPAVLLGLTANSNLFVEEDGDWVADRYIPAFIRRYPFVSAETDGGNDDFTVCIDQPMLTDDENGVRLFDDEGADTAVLSHAIGFLSDYQQHVTQTRAFMKQLRESGLLEAKTIRVERAGIEAQVLSGFSVVNEAKLQKLPAKTLAALSKTGALGLVYVHLLSLTNVQRLAARADAIRGE
ncbi:MAG: SapC family protein [Proteobacteria bacterium]|nr:SapC family protein [Pseudomonadota bacterium]